MSLWCAVLLSLYAIYVLHLLFSYVTINVRKHTECKVIPAQYCNVSSLFFNLYYYYYYFNCSLFICCFLFKYFVSCCIFIIAAIFSLALLIGLWNRFRILIPIFMFFHGLLRVFSLQLFDKNNDHHLPLPDAADLYPPKGICYLCRRSIFSSVGARYGVNSSRRCLHNISLFSVLYKMLFSLILLFLK